MTQLKLYCGLLYLLLLAPSGFFAACPVEISPPSLVVRYGDSASATCRALEPISGMGWESTLGAVGLEEGVTELNWTVKELREWTMRPQCFINPEDGEQCLKELAVVVYKMPDSVTLTIGDPGPKDVGTIYNLTCRIENFNPVQNLTVRWFKREVLWELVQEVVREEDNSMGPQNKTYEWQLIFKPSDNGAEYYCEAGLGLTPDPHIPSQPVLVTVHYPPSHSEDEVLLLERDTTLNCTADANPPPSYTWKTSGTQEAMDKTPVLTIDEAGNYTCTASNRLGSGTKHFIVESRSSGTFWAIIGAGVGVIFILVLSYGILKWKAGANSII